MSIEQAVRETIIVVLAIYGGISLIRDSVWKIILSLIKCYTLRKEIKLIEARKNWEKIPDCGGTVEGELLAAEAILKSVTSNKFQRSRLGNV